MMQKSAASLAAASFAFTLLAASAARAQVGEGAVDVRKMVAVLDFQPGEGVDAAVSDPITEGVIASFVSRGDFKVIDRAHRDSILAEQGFQCSDMVGECRVEAGQMLGVGRLVTGRIHKLGSTFVVSATMLDVETGEVVGQGQTRCQCQIDQLLDVPRDLVARLMRSGPVAAAARPEPAPLPPQAVGETPGETSDQRFARNWSRAGLSSGELAEFKASDQAFDLWIQDQIDSGQSTRTWGYVAGGGGFALLAGGVGIWALSGWLGCAGKSDQVPPGRERSPRQVCSEEHAGGFLAGAAVAGLGAVAAGTGVYLWFRGNSEVHRYESARKRASGLGLAIAPMSGGGRVVASLRF